MGVGWDWERGEETEVGMQYIREFFKKNTAKKNKLISKALEKDTVQLINKEMDAKGERLGCWFEHEKEK